MESMIRNIIQEELRKSGQGTHSSMSTACTTSSSVAPSSSHPTTSSMSSSFPKDDRKVQSRLTNLLTKIRKKGKEKFKEIKIQFRWQQEFAEEREVVKPRAGGDSRFLIIDKDEDPDFQTLAERAIDMFFPDGNSINQFKVHDFSQREVSLTDTIREFLKTRGLFSSRTWFFLTTEIEGKKDFHSQKRIKIDTLPKVVCPKVECPICFHKFEKSQIENHASTCSAEIFDDESTDFDISDHEITPPPPQDEINVEERIVELIKAQDETSTQSLRIIRHKAWTKYIEHCEKKWFRLTATLQISFIGENAVGDGPRREFFQVAMIQMVERLFENGEPKVKAIAIQNSLFYHAGQLLAQCILQGGPTPNILSFPCYRVISSARDKTPSFTLNDIPDIFKDEPVIKKMLTATNDTEFSKILMEDETFQMLENIGYCGVPSREKISNRESIINAIFYSKSVLPKLPALWQLFDGLQLRGLGTLVKENPKFFEKIFVKDQNNLSFEILNDNIRPRFSDEGTNSRTKEMALFEAFIDYIEFVSHDPLSKVSLADLCQFLTGGERMSYGGLENR